jgi:hypothetical protein
MPKATVTPELFQKLLAYKDDDDRTALLEGASGPAVYDIYRRLIDHAGDFGIDEKEKKHLPREAVHREILRLVNRMLGKVEDNDHGQGKKDKFVAEHTSESDSGQTRGDYLVRNGYRDRSAERAVPYSQDAIPDTKRVYVPLGVMLRSVGLDASEKNMQRFRDLIGKILLDNSRFITLSDDHVAAPDKVFFWASSRPDFQGGDNTFYCDDCAGSYLLQEAGMYEQRPKDTRLDWETALQFNLRLGRKSNGTDTSEVEKFLLKTRGEKSIELDGKQVDPNNYIALYRSANTKKSAGGKGYSIYCSPELEPYAREHLICNVPSGKAHWVNEEKTMRLLHVKGDFKDRYAYREILQEMKTNNPVISFVKPAGDVVEATARKHIGQFRVGGRRSAGGAWRVDPEILGQVIKGEDIKQRRAKILADPSQLRLMMEHQAATSRGEESLAV